jgi:TolB-like protein/Tfp pilus assembly protein PilF
MISDSPSEYAIRDELTRVLSSAAFVRNERQSNFLRFLVERHLQGRDAELKETVVAMEVFGRQADYDPKVDAIVRTEAIRLRARLHKYYTAAGRDNQVVIELPKGGYRPLARWREPLQPGVTARPIGYWLAARWHWLAVGAASIVAIATAWVLTTRPSAVRPPIARLTIAVLPLQNVGSATDSLSDALTDELIADLSMIDGLSVRSRMSSFALKGKPVTAPEAGRQLAVDYLVEGSVVQNADQLRVNAELVRVGDDTPLWSGRFDRTASDALATQDDISHSIVNTLQLTLPGRRRYETNLEAYNLYLRGRQMMASFPAGAPAGGGRPIAELAVAYFEGAIAKQTNYALGYAGLADTLRSIDENILKPEAYARAKTAAQSALELDPMLSEAQAAMAGIFAHEYAWQQAERGFRRAIELNANNALAHLELGASVLLPQRHLQEGLDEARRGLALDSLSPYMNTEFGRVLLEAGHYHEAVDQLRHAIALEPTRPTAYDMLGRALYLQGDINDASIAFEQSMKRGGPPIGVPWLICVEERAGQHEKALALVKRHQANVRKKGGIAAAYGCLGDAERAFQFLNEAVEEHEPAIAHVLDAPELAWLHADPRFETLRRRLNLGPTP